MLDFLRAYKGALLVISHDLELLDEAITRVLHLDRPDEDSEGTIDGKDHPGLRRQSGRIGFLGYGDKVSFRNIRIRELN